MPGAELIVILLTLVVTIAWFVVQYWRSPELRIDETTSHRWSPLAGAGAYTKERLLTSALVSLPVLVMIPIGTRVRARLSGPGFDRAVLGVLVVSAVALSLRMFSS